MTRDSWPVIIGGCHRSGSSMIRRILNVHSAIYCGPEVKFFRDFYNDYLDDPIRHIRFPETARDMLPEDELLRVLGSAFVTMHEEAAARAGKRRWADKNPENVLHLDKWARLLGDQWLLVHLVRNPLDTLASFRRVNFCRTLPEDLDQQIEFYRQYTQAGIAFGKTFPDRYYRVVYEDFVSHPESELEDLMKWMGEKVEPGQFNFNAYHHDRGIEDPFVSTTKKISADRIGRWHEKLSTGEADHIRDKTRDITDILDCAGAS